LKRLLTLSLFLVLVAAVGWFGKEALGPHLGTGELALALAVVAAVGVRWLLVVRRRQRQKVEEMRDSALW
jgi:hypothetical protein